MSEVNKHPNWGGKREGGGRRPKWGCKTTVIRVPEYMVEEIMAFVEEKMKDRKGK